MCSLQQLNMLIDLYKFYLELILQSGVLAGAAVGGVLGYFIKQKDLVEKVRIIPCFLSSVFTIIYGVSIWPGIELAHKIYFLGKEQELHLIPHAWLLPTIIAFFFIVFAISSIFIFYLPNYITKKENKIKNIN